MEDYKVWAEGVLQKVREKMDWCSEKNRDKIPYTTDGLGNYDDRSDETKEWSNDNGINWWTNGFWGGIMWLLYQDTKKEKYADIARISEQKLAKCFEIYYGLHHDVGFMFLPTAVADYRLTGNKEAKRLAMHGANLLAGRFNPAGNFIRAWNQTGNDDTRGWAIYGFANSYAHTGKQEYLDAAKRCAHYCIANLPESGIIPVDFRQPKEPAWEDSCGACVIAGGLLEIAKHVPELEKDMYVNAAVKILKAIAETRADWGKDCDAIVKNCTSAYHSPEHHFTMVYADYYFIEALYKLTGTGILLW